MEKGLMENGITAKEGLEKKSRGPMFLSNAYGKVRSRYLKPPMGSCHDLCKFGHKHEPDDERKHAVFRRFMANSIASDAVQNHVRDLNTGDGRKSPGLKLKASDKVSKERKMQTILQDSPVEVNHMKSLNPNKKKKKKKEAVKPKASPLFQSPTAKQNKFNQRSSSASTEVTLDGAANIFKEKVASYMKETTTSSAMKVNRQKKMTAGKLCGSSSKLQSEKKIFSPASKKIDGSAKPAISLKARTPLSRPVAQLNATRNVGKNFKILEDGDRNFLKLQKASIYSKPPVHDVVSLKTRKFKNLEHVALERGEKPDDGVDIHDKIQEIIETNSENEDMVVSDENSSKESDGYISESCVSELSEIEDVQSCGPSEEEGRRRVRRTPAAQPDDSSSLPYKMKFKRGRVVDLRPTENVGPRRLRFRRGRVLDEKSNGEVMKKTFRKSDRANMKAPLASSLESSAVMLKHQAAQEKKDMQALFNYVIEETANKLAETKKSKVKALVGAFETVISLQESKAAQIV